MSIWPWRTRPVITPFSDDYSASLLTYPGPYTSAPVSLSVPSNTYFVPTSISLTFTTSAGIRGTSPSWVEFARGQLFFAGCIFAALLSNRTLRFFLTNLSESGPALKPDLCLTSSLPYPIYLYPDDLIVLNIPSMLAGDVLSPVIIEGRMWESH